MSDASEGTVLVTGANGFLGQYVVEALGLAGIPVRAAVRAAAVIDGVETVRVGAINKDTDWSGALKGVRAIVHLAAHVHRSSAAHEREAFFEVNTAGTRRLAEAAVAAGVQQLIFLSSIAVNGSATGENAPFSENSTPHPSTPYGESKLAAELALEDLSRRNGLRVSVVRPPMIYGREAKGNFRLLQRLIGAGVPLPFGGIRNRRAFVAGSNVASLIVHCLVSQSSPFEVFLVADDEQISTPEFCRRIGRALGRPARLVNVPPALLRLGLRGLGRSDILDSLLASLTVDTTKARDAGWSPPASIDDAMARAVLRQN